MTSPMATSSHLSRFSASTFSDPFLYLFIVGALQYLTITRPDIAYSVNNVSQFMQLPTDEHWAAVKCILRYLKRRTSYGLLLQPISRLQLHAFTNADWLNGPMSANPPVGMAFFLALTFSARVPRNRLLLHCHAPRLSIVVFLLPLASFFGFNLYYLNLVILFVARLSFGVITLELSISLPIPSSTVALNTSRLMSILFGISL